MMIFVKYLYDKSLEFFFFFLSFWYLLVKNFDNYTWLIYNS